MTERRIGIDFGTSTSVVRVRRYGGGRPIDVIPKAVTFNNGASMVPTLIQRLADGKCAYFGYDAEVQRRQTTICQNFKLDLESPDPKKREDARKLTAEFFAYLGKVYAQQSTGNFLGESSDAERTFISYPVKWSEDARQFMIRAAEAAGFPNVEGLDEAQASIRAVTEQYAGVLSKKGYIRSGAPCNILLIDMGAGTTDLVLCRYTHGASPRVEILNTWPRDGHALFGGSRVDELLYEYIAGSFPDVQPVKRIHPSKFKAWKETVVSPALLNGESVDYFDALSVIEDTLGVDLRFEPIDRKKFETIAAEYLRALPKLISDALQTGSAGPVSGDDVDLVILTGGHSQWYFVREMLLGKMPQFGEVNLPRIAAAPDRIISIARPQETVALGLVYLPQAAPVEALHFVPAVEPSCTGEGNIAHWASADGERLFRDEDGTKPITPSEAKLDMLGHSFEWRERGQERVCVCTKCGTIRAVKPLTPKPQSPQKPQPQAPASREDPTPESEFQLGNVGEDYVIVKYLGNRSRVIIPEQIRGRKVVAIEKRAFYRGNMIWRYGGNKVLEYVEIPKTVTKIGQDAFVLCRKLTRVKMHEGIEEIGSAAFMGCDNLAYISFDEKEQPLPGIVKFPRGMKSIGSGAFRFFETGKSYLKEITLSKKTKLLPWAFSSSPFEGCAIFYYENQNGNRE